MAYTKEQDSAKPHPSLFTDFDLPMGNLLARAIRRFSELEFPLLEQIEITTVDHFAQPGQVGKGFSLGLTKLVAEGVMDHDDLLGTKVEAWACLAYGIGIQFGRGMARNFFTTMGAVTRETGNVMSANGKPLSHDHLLDLFERVDFEVDDEGNPKDVVLIGPPQLREQIAALPPMTPEQEARLEAIKQVKREAQNAKRRLRALD